MILILKIFIMMTIPIIIIVGRMKIPKAAMKMAPTPKFSRPRPLPLCRVGLRPSRSAGVRPFDKAIQASKERH